MSHNGGHLASNLGVVELTVALGLAFDPPQDTILWDVGHQSYAYKLLTGRSGQFSTIRKEGGLAGFPCREESPYDLFTLRPQQHLHLRGPGRLRGQPPPGQGGLRGGGHRGRRPHRRPGLRGPHNAGRLHRNLIVILNDNTMSISKNVGSMARYLTYIRTKPGYIKVKNNVESSLQRLPVVGKAIARGLRRLKDAIKKLFTTPPSSTTSASPTMAPSTATT